MVVLEAPALRNPAVALAGSVAHQAARYLPWYAGPDWPAAREIGYLWIGAASVLAVVTIVAGAEAALWLSGHHSVSWQATRAPVLRFAVGVLVALALAETAWAMHTNGSYGGQ